MKMLKWAAVSVSFFATSLYADTVRLVNAPVDAVTAYFSQLTGNAYILDFTSEKTVSILKEVSGNNNIHALFVELIESLGGDVQQTSTTSFRISQKTAEVVATTNVSPELSSPEIALQRIYLGNKISKDGVGDLIRTVPILNSLTVISDGSNLDAVLVSGEVASIGILKNLIGTLDAVKKPEKPNLDLNTGLSSNDKGQLSETGNSTLQVVDLNFADAEELVATLGPLLSSDANTAAISVSAHQSANQVILSGSSKALAQALSVIALMDRAPRQVYVDAIIAEVSEDSALKLGLQFSVNKGSFSSSVVTGLTGNNIGTLAGNALPYWRSWRRDCDWSWLK